MTLDRKWRRGEFEPIKRDRAAKPPEHWREQEATGARAHGGAVTRGSGCGWRPDRKLDSVGNRWRMSNKTTAGGKKDAKSIRVEREWFEEAKRAAWAEQHQPAVMFGFDPDYRDVREDWIAVPAAVFKRINEIMDAVAAGDIEAAHAVLALLDRPV